MRWLRSDDKPERAIGIRRRKLVVPTIVVLVLYAALYGFRRGPAYVVAILVLAFLGFVLLALRRDRSGSPSRAAKRVKYLHSGKHAGLGGRDAAPNDGARR